MDEQLLRKIIRIIVEVILQEYDLVEKGSLSGAGSPPPAEPVIDCSDLRGLKLISENDIKKLDRSVINIRVDRKAIFTPSALDQIRDRKIKVIKD